MISLRFGVQGKETNVAGSHLECLSTATIQRCSQFQSVLSQLQGGKGTMEGPGAGDLLAHVGQKQSRKWGAGRGTPFQVTPPAATPNNTFSYGFLCGVTHPPPRAQPPHYPSNHFPLPLSAWGLGGGQILNPKHHNCNHRNY